MRKVQIVLTFECDEDFWNTKVKQFQRDINSGIFQNEVLQAHQEKGLQNFKASLNEIQEEE